MFALVALVALAVPQGALAQSAIAGVVKDTTGAVLPGVTVEASSPALIEKTKTAAIAKAKELAAKDVTATFYSKPILFRIVTPSAATQPTTKPTTQPVKK